MSDPLDPHVLGRGVRVVFADRRSGSSHGPYARGNLADHVGDDAAAVATNRAALARRLGVAPGDLVAMTAQHGADVAHVHAADASRPPAVDAMVTTDAGCGLLVLAADCVPVLLADPRARVVGVVHAGWRGVRAGAVSAAVEAMAAYGADHVRAVVGPAVCGRCYGVDEERYAAVTAVAPAAAATTRDGAPGLDLRAGVVAELAGHGVLTRLWGGCTVEQDSWFSYRRDRVTGRHGGAVALLGR